MGTQSCNDNRATKCNKSIWTCNKTIIPKQPDDFGIFRTTTIWSSNIRELCIHQLKNLGPVTQNLLRTCPGHNLPRGRAV